MPASWRTRSSNWPSLSSRKSCGCVAHAKGLIDQLRAVAGETGLCLDLVGDALRRLKHGVKVVIGQELLTAEREHVGVNLASDQFRTKPASTLGRLR